eukprot:scaffold9114_cov118-Isochrysis_galbana.AAC.1
MALVAHPAAQCRPPSRPIRSFLLLRNDAWTRRKRQERADARRVHESAREIEIRCCTPQAQFQPTGTPPSGLLGVGPWRGALSGSG